MISTTFYVSGVAIWSVWRRASPCMMPSRAIFEAILRSSRVEGKSLDINLYVFYQYFSYYFPGAFYVCKSRVLCSTCTFINLTPTHQSLSEWRRTSPVFCYSTKFYGKAINCDIISHGIFPTEQIICSRTIYVS